jgi:anti-anti-sigma factor
MIGRTVEKKVVSFKLTGDWDFSRRDELQLVLRPAEVADEVVQDFSELTFIDASVLGSLIRLLKRVVNRNHLGTIRIVAASRNVARLFEVCNL